MQILPVSFLCDRSRWAHSTRGGSYLPPVEYVQLEPRGHNVVTKFADCSYQYSMYIVAYTFTLKLSSEACVQYVSREGKIFSTMSIVK